MADVEVIKITPKTSKTFGQRYGKYYDNEELSDVTFLVGKKGIKIFGHSQILVSASDYFKVRFSKEWKKIGSEATVISIEESDEEAFRTILVFIYKASLEFNWKDTHHILVLANLYLLKDLIDLLTTGEGFMKYGLKCVWQFLSFAILVNDVDLINRCVNCIDQNTYEAFDSEDFLSVDESVIRQVISRDTLYIKETDLFLALINWSEAECRRKGLAIDGSNRRSVMAPFIHRIRFPTMTLHEFRTNVEPFNILTESERLIIYSKGIGSDTKDKTGFDFRNRRVPQFPPATFADLISVHFPKCLNITETKWCRYLHCKECAAKLCIACAYNCHFDKCKSNTLSPLKTGRLGNCMCDEKGRCFKK
jgi:hypothetical protein